MDENRNQDEKRVLDERRILDQTDLDRIYGLPKPWQRKHRRLGDGPPFLRIGRMIRYCRSDVERWLAEHYVKTE
jgi:predicted DNA-binding transcriptional regulator AlpA